MSKMKNILKIALIALIVGHIGMYIAQRSEWLYEGQPYRKAKEWLIGAKFYDGVWQFSNQTTLCGRKKLYRSACTCFAGLFHKKMERKSAKR